MKLKINPFNRGNPMSLRDAAIVSSLVALTTWILTFLANSSASDIRADPWAFVFEALKTYLVTWAGTFITLSGLEQYIKRKKGG